MDDTTNGAPLYTVERSDDGPETWRLVGPNGLAGVYASASEAQARAEYLNDQVAEEMEDDS